MARQKASEEPIVVLGEASESDEESDSTYDSADEIDEDEKETVDRHHKDEIEIDSNQITNSIEWKQSDCSLEKDLLCRKLCERNCQLRTELIRMKKSDCKQVKDRLQELQTNIIRHQTLLNDFTRTNHNSTEQLKKSILVLKQLNENIEQRFANFTDKLKKGKV